MVVSWVILWFEYINSTRNRVSIYQRSGWFIICDAQLPLLRFPAWDKWLATGSTILWAKPLGCLSWNSSIPESRNFWVASVATFLGVGMVRDVSWMAESHLLVGAHFLAKLWRQGWGEGTASHPAAALGWKLRFSPAVREIYKDETKKGSWMFQFFSLNPLTMWTY